MTAEEIKDAGPTGVESSEFWLDAHQVTSAVASSYIGIKHTSAHLKQEKRKQEARTFGMARQWGVHVRGEMANA